MLSDQQVETFIYSFRQEIAALKAQQVTTLNTLNQLQTSITTLNSTISTSTNTSGNSGNIGLDTYAVGGGILHKLVTTFQAIVNFAAGVLFNASVTFTGLTASLPLQLNSSKVVISALINLGTMVTGTLTVNKGGTGQVALTLFSVLAGNGTGVVNFISPGTAGFVLTDNGAAAFPTFQAPVAPSAIANGTYTTGGPVNPLGLNGTITFVNGKITAIQEAT